MPIWNGEWGPVYQNAEDGLPDWEHINDTRYAVLKTQLDIYHEANASWSIWLYKDIGFQGMIYVSEDTPYMKKLKPFLQKKKVSISSGQCPLAFVSLSNSAGRRLGVAILRTLVQSSGSSGRRVGLR